LDGVSVFIVGGVVLGFGIASGLNVYGAVAAIGLASRTGWLELAPGLRGLQSPIVTGSAVLLFLIDIYADRSPRTQRWWGALHTIVRPLAASSLAAVALSAAPVQPPMWLWLAATFTTGIVALLVHASKTGARLLFSVSGERGRGRAVAWMEDALALALGPLILARPAETLWIAALIMVALGVFGRWLWRAFLLGPRALAALGAGFFGVRGWVEARELPPWVAGALTPPTPGQARHRGAKASLHGAPGRFRNGWFVVGGDGPRFLFRATSGRVREVPLAAAHCESIQADAWVDRLPLGANGTSSTLFLLKDGPDPLAVQRLFAPGAPPPP
jgi:hypothetical protein